MVYFPAVILGPTERIFNAPCLVSSHPDAPAWLTVHLDFAQPGPYIKASLTTAVYPPGDSPDIIEDVGSVMIDPAVFLKYFGLINNYSGDIAEASTWEDFPDRKNLNCALMTHLLTVICEHHLESSTLCANAITLVDYGAVRSLSRIKIRVRKFRNGAYPQKHDLQIAVKVPSLTIPVHAVEVGDGFIEVKPRSLTLKFDRPSTTRGDLWRCEPYRIHDGLYFTILLNSDGNRESYYAALRNDLKPSSVLARDVQYAAPTSEPCGGGRFHLGIQGGYIVPITKNKTVCMLHPRKL